MARSTASTASLVSLLFAITYGLMPVAGWAEIKTIVATGAYIMGDAESPLFAEARALQNAKQTALEEAGTYVESYTRVKNQDLTAEEVQTIAGGILNITVVDKKRELSNDGLRFVVKIRATIVTDSIESLAQRVKDRKAIEEYAELQRSYKLLLNHLRQLNEQLASGASEGTDRNRTIELLRSQETAYLSLVRKEKKFFERLVEGKQVVQAARDERAEVESVVQTLVHDGHRVELGPVTAHKEASTPIRWFPWGNWPLTSPSEMVVTVPVSISVSAETLIRIEEASHRLGGRGIGVRRKLQIKHYLPDDLSDVLGNEGPVDLRFQRATYRTEKEAHIVSIAPYHEVERYVRQQLSDLRLIMTYVFADGDKETCVVPQQLNPVFAGRYWDSISAVSAGLNEEEYNALIAIVQPVRFILEQGMSESKAKRLQSIAGEFRSGSYGGSYCRVRL